MKATLLATLSASLLAAALTGCGAPIPKFNANKEPPKIYGVMYRPLPPDPVYNRLRWVHLPAPIPGGKEMAESDAPTVQQMLHLEVKGVTLEKAAKMLASSARYGSFISSNVADQRVSLNRLGTLDDLAQALASAAKARVVVDHSGRTLRFMGGVTEP